MNVYSYWEGPQPEYISLCLRIAKRRADVKMASVADVPKYAGDSYFEALSPAHKADLIRVETIATMGGIWMDADCVLLEDPRKMLKHLNGKFAYYHDGDTFANGFFAASPGHPVMEEWARLNRAVFLNHKAMGTLPKNVPWRSFGSDQMVEILRHPLGAVMDLGAHRIQPIAWQHRELFFDKFEDPKELALSVWHGAYAYMLYNNTFPAWFKEMSVDGILEGKWRISAIFKAALRS